MRLFDANTVSRPRGRAEQLREAVLLTFCEPLPVECARLMHLPRDEWQSLLRWLDTSGLALYFFDRLIDLNLVEILPLHVLTRFEQNLADNAVRMDAMINESSTIQSRFQEAGLSYAVLKGFSLWPVSVPKLELRSQLDQDFLVAEESAMEARRILEDSGYRLHAISGRSWEFKANEGRPPSLRDIYKAGKSRSAELHIDAACADGRSPLSRCQRLYFHDISMPILSPVDLFLGQGLHLYKHVCSEFSRAAHMIEFRRHVISRYGDDIFWGKLRKQVAGDPGTCIRLGLITQLISHMMGRFAPEKFTCWTVDQLPIAASRWVDIYGSRTVLSSFPGTKLYLLLQSELEAVGVPSKRSVRHALLPRHLPPFIVHEVAGESLLARLSHYRRQLRFIGIRLRFHLMGGIGYLRESILWRQYRNGVSQ